jgi:hypothetical protein
MKIQSIERTPNPNSMRVVLSTELPSGTSYNYTKKDVQTASEPHASLLKIEGLQGIYHVMNFMAIEKSAESDWDQILEEVKSVLPAN